MAIEHSSVKANGITFHVASAGPEGARAVLCLHGFPEGWMCWRPVMERLSGVRMHAPDLRGYPGTTRPRGGYDVLTLTADIRALIEAIDLDRPLLVGHDWGGELGWIFAHRYSALISGFVAVNGPHPKTLARAVLRNQDLQALRLPWIPLFQVPRLPELVMTTALGRSFLRLSFTLREGTRGTMDRALVRELVSRFQHPDDIRGPIDYYRQIVRTYLVPSRRRTLEAIYEVPISVPITLVWGEKDGALTAGVARGSGEDAGHEVEWRPLPGVGHFVGLEAPGEAGA